MSSSPDLRIENLPIRQLNRGRNTRHHSSHQIGQIAESIKTFGFIVPALVDAKNNVVAGFGRIAGAERIGHSEIPVIRLEHLSETQLKAFQVADNRLAENSSWDDQLLAETLKELSEIDLDFNVEVTGFSTPEIDLRIQSLSGSSPAPDPADEIPDNSNNQPISRPGDMWRLGPHLVLCGDALLSNSYGAILGTELASLIFADLPYNVPIKGHVSGRGHNQHREFKMAAGEMDEAEFTLFLTKACSLMAKHSKDGSIHFLCMDWRHIREILEAGRVAYVELKNLCIWVKDNGGMGSHYRSRYELVFMFKHGDAPHRNNVQLGKFGRNRTNVWEYPSANTFSRQSDEGNLAALHPTVKPIAMVADAIMDCSARGDIVLDPFLGSGTTLVAAERVGRICRGVEIDPLYVDTVVRRWQAYCGDKAFHAVTGTFFDDLAGQAEAGNVGG